MRINANLKCDMPCGDIEKLFTYPDIDIKPEKIKMVLISEAPSAEKKDYFYEKGEPFFFSTTQQAFRDAGYLMKDIDTFIKKGIYLTTAIKCPKKDYLVSANTLKQCSFILEKELDQFKKLKVIMLMGDFAIKSMNMIIKRKYKKSVIPSGSTYKIRKGEFILEGIRYFPSYTQTGKAYFIEKVKREMIAEDIKRAMEYLFNG
jgi:uracil-DNA glycosylase